MDRSPRTFLLFFVLGIFLLPQISFAHQPRIPDGTVINVIDPEVSKAYYTQLSGEPHVYRIVSDKSFALYVNVLVPDIAGQKKDVTAVILKDGNILSVLDGTTFTWTQFWEPFGYDMYWMGPEYKTQAEAGKYEIRVSSTNNDSKYSLAIGEKENFDLKESVNALYLVPKIKRDFFNESPANFIFSFLGYGYVGIMFVLAFVFGFIYRFAMKKFAKNSSHGLGKNIGKKGRLIRAGAGLVLFAFAIMTTWNPIILFFAGFCFFESIFSWCGVYAALGKNTCPV
jgi:hypothetical protein